MHGLHQKLLRVRRHALISDARGQQAEVEVLTVLAQIEDVLVHPSTDDSFKVAALKKLLELDV